MIVGQTICELAFGFPQWLSSAINIGIQVTCALRGNHWYKLHVEKKLRESAPADASTEAIRLQLAKEGGTNLGAAIGLCAGFVLLAMLANNAG